MFKIDKPMTLAFLALLHQSCFLFKKEIPLSLEQKLDQKILFFKKYNDNQQLAVKFHEYAYPVSYVKNAEIEQLEIKMPSQDCNATWIECRKDSKNEYFCKGFKTLLKCKDEKTVKGYYFFPERLKIKMIDQKNIEVIDLKNNSKAQFQIYDNMNEVPTYNEPINEQAITPI